MQFQFSQANLAESSQIGHLCICSRHGQDNAATDQKQRKGIDTENEQKPEARLSAKTRLLDNPPSITAGLGDGTNMAWTRSGVNIPPINNLARLFQALFVQSDDATRAVERETLLNRGSVLDALSESARALKGQLNAADRGKLDQYFTSVRDVERRLQMSREWVDKPKSPIKPIVDEDHQLRRWRSINSMRE
jgi:hypothetical protein